MNPIYVEGDILTDVLDENTIHQGVIVCHQVNCKGVMGAGLALQIKRKHPHVYQEYLKKCQQTPNSRDCLGDVQFISCISQSGYTVANIFGQDGVGRNKQQTDYNALEKAMSDIGRSSPTKIIRIPLFMGCGLGGGNWGVVMDVIDKTLVQKGVQVEVWCKN